MLIGIISDTHDHIEHTKQAVSLFKQRNVDVVIHAGDYCSPFMIPLFEGLPMQGVFGNNDGDLQTLLKKADEADVEIAGGFLEVKADDCSIAVYHGTYQGITDALHSCGKYDVVISGHTHETVSKRVGNTLAINPGTANGFDGDATIAFLDTDAMEVVFTTL
ncbi:MAG: metallophosphoesterase [Balneolaceae bacterium]|nr:metallophosphoesterase [Balneolaceae bacterium]